MKTYQRKSLLVNPSFQIKYIFILVVFFVATVFITVWGNSGYIIFALKIILFSIVLAFIGLVITNRIAGPIYRLSHDIRKMADDADLTVQFTVREHDELKEVVVSLNHMVALFRERLILDDDFREKVLALCGSMRSMLNKKELCTEEEKKQLLHYAETLMHECGKSSVKFKL